jgi:hypothetical protein
MITIDCETVGFHGMAVLIQYAIDDGPVILHEVWTRPAQETLDLIEMFTKNTIIGFNLAFDWFHIAKLYTVFSLLPDTSVEPIDVIDEIAELEPLGRDGPCVKPVSCFDVMLHARKGPYQSTMDRSDIRIRRVPTDLAWRLAEELEKRIELSPVLFAKRKDKSRSIWDVYDIEDDDGEINPNFKDIVLKFAPSSALKALAADALKIPVDNVLRFIDIAVDKAFHPEEHGYAPFAKAIGNRHNWNGAWPSVIHQHISHWGYHQMAREYAKKDVVYTRDLYKHFGSPPVGDDDSILACMVAVVRWRGYKADIQGLKDLKAKTLASKVKILPDGSEFQIPTAPAQARIYVQQLMDATERLVVQDSTKKVLLQEVGKWKIPCPTCAGVEHLDHEIGIVGKCPQCNGKKEIQHPAAIRALEVLEARQANYEADLYDKFILAGRFHASFIVIGTLSSRMAGTDGLNAQGVKKTKEVRSKFPLAWDGTVLCGGDFSGFEVTLAEACYNDPDLRTDLQSGKKIHALFGVHVFPDMTYEEILATEGTKDDRYTRCKQAVFAMFYGGEGFTLKDRLGVDIETADKAYDAFCKRYKQVGVARKKVFDMFCSMRQPGGLGGRVEWHTPSDYIESMFGFRRYFNLENKICKALYDLSSRPPREWANLKIRVTRRDRTQTASGAVQSALYGAAFSLQASNMRAAANHVIQSSGAQITKLVQRKIWDVQPFGINEWRVQPMNIHDEIMCPTMPPYIDEVAVIVKEVVESIRPKVPLVKMDWQKKLESWADKS